MRIRQASVVVVVVARPQVSERCVFETDTLDIGRPNRETTSSETYAGGMDTVRALARGLVLAEVAKTHSAHFIGIHHNGIFPSLQRHQLRELGRAARLLLNFHIWSGPCDDDLWPSLPSALLHVVSQAPLHHSQPECPTRSTQASDTPLPHPYT